MSVLIVERCQGSQCESRPNLVGPIVGSICGILILALIAVFLVWIYYKRKYRPTREVPKEIEQPPLYTGTISTTDTSSAFYSTTPLPDESHFYERINYNAIS